MSFSSFSRRFWRHYIPARVSEVLAAVSLTTTFILFIHTNHLQSQLQLFSTQFGSIDPAVAKNSGTDPESRLIQPLLRSKESLQLLLRDRDDLYVHKQYTSNISYRSNSFEKYPALSLRSLNITKADAKLTLVFNRVPKVGSQFAMELLRTLSYANGFTFHKDRPKKTENIKLSLREQRRLAQLISLFRPPSVYAKHVCYLNFTAFAFAQPIYINMVRDPVERAVSWYYYVRAPWYFVERKMAFPDLPLPSASWLRKDYESCVVKNDKECMYEEGQIRPDFAQLTEFFCGQDSKCTGFNTKFALEKAKYNVEKHYAVVGVLEELNMTLTVLEHYLPRFFEGAKDVYYNQLQRLSKVNRNLYKPKVTEEVKNIVRKNFTREIEFYEFCKQRLYKQYAALNLT